MVTEQEKAAAHDYWMANVKLIVILLAIWALVSYVFGILLANPLNNIYLGSLPLGFWWAQQGSMFTFIILIFVYAYLMDRLDQKYGVQE